jgi:hypothetical protein
MRAGVVQLVTLRKKVGQSINTLSSGAWCVEQLAQLHGVPHAHAQARARVAQGYCCSSRVCCRRHRLRA